MTRLAMSGLAALGLAILAGAGFYFFGPGAATDRFSACRSGTLAGTTAGIGGPFTLVSESGETVTDRDVITGPTLLYFGYTFCPDVCPFDNARNADAVSLLEARGYQVTPVFISIDPGRDTPEVVAQFTDYLHPRMLGLTGSPEQVRAASRAYRTFFRIQDPDEEYYLIDHSTFTYLAFPETGVVEVFGRDVTPEDMADRVACFIDSL
jgi:protein SCO1/2